MPGKKGKCFRTYNQVNLLDLCVQKPLVIVVEECQTVGQLKIEVIRASGSRGGHAKKHNRAHHQSINEGRRGNSDKSDRTILINDNDGINRMVPKDMSNMYISFKSTSSQNRSESHSSRSSISCIQNKVQDKSKSVIDDSRISTSKNKRERRSVNLNRSCKIEL